MENFNFCRICRKKGWGFVKTVGLKEYNYTRITRTLIGDSDDG